VKPRPAPQRGTTTAPQFILLLYEDAAYQQASDRGSRVSEYSAWARSLAAAGQLVAADELSRSGDVLNGALAATPLGVNRMNNQPTGYFMITATDEAAALRIASTCPHLRYGGRIVMLRIVT
jgi:hypothetical protein